MSEAEKRELHERCLHLLEEAQDLLQEARRLLDSEAALSPEQWITEVDAAMSRWRLA